jgi:hypothetical protein
MEKVPKYPRFSLKGGDFCHYFSISPMGGADGAALARCTPCDNMPKIGSKMPLKSI